MCVRHAWTQTSTTQFFFFMKRNEFVVILACCFRHARTQTSVCLFARTGDKTDIICVVISSCCVSLLAAISKWMLLRRTHEGEKERYCVCVYVCVWVLAKLKWRRYTACICVRMDYLSVCSLDVAGGVVVVGVTRTLMRTSLLWQFDAHTNWCDGSPEKRLFSYGYYLHVEMHFWKTIVTTFFLSFYAYRWTNSNVGISDFHWISADHRSILHIYILLHCGHLF